MSILSRDKEPKAPKTPKTKSDKEALKRAKQDAPKQAIAFGLGRKKADATTAFRYSALDGMGKKVSGVETALSSGAVHMLLLERGLQPLDVSTKSSLLKLEITKKKVPRSDVMNFTRQLAVFMKAGIPIMESLEVIADETQTGVRATVMPGRRIVATAVVPANAVIIKNC